MKGVAELRDIEFCLHDTEPVLIAFGSPRLLPEEGEGSHNCDEMGCGSVGPHALAYIRISTAQAELLRSCAPICRGCGKPIDPDCCGCGAGPEAHSNPMNDGHPFVPLGCDCLRAKP